MKVRRAGISDWYVEDGEGVALVGEEVLVLSPLATVLVEHLGSRWVSLSAATDVLVASFGAPEDGSATPMTRQILEHLAALGVVELTGA